MGYSVRSIVPPPDPVADTDDAGLADDAGLRVTLRDVPVLPAPANVDDLLARLDAETIPAGPLAEIISDARVVDPEPDEAYDPFFAPLAQVANGNMPQPGLPAQPARVSRLPLVLFTAGLLAVTVLIGRNALMSDVAAPEPVAPALRVGSAEPAPAAIVESAPAAIVEPEALSEPVLAEMSREPGEQLTLEDAAPRPQAADIPDALASMEPIPPALPPIPQIVTETPATVGQPQDAQETLPSIEAILASTEPGGQPQAEPVTLTPEPSPPASLPERSGDTVAAIADARDTVPKPVRAARARVPFAGVWAPSAEACAPAGREDGSLLTHINAHRARAGDTTCAFRRTRRSGDVWTVTAVCSNGETSWNSLVQLSLGRRSLTWNSQKGSTTYVRCPRA